MSHRRRLIVWVTVAAFLTANGSPARCCLREEEHVSSSHSHAGDVLDDTDEASDPCPHSHDDSSCPCPGGCAYCNGAKIPCPFPAVRAPELSPCLERSIADLSPLYTPPCSGKFNRPPRI